MFSSWFNPNASKKKESHISSLSHFVLGTPLQSPPSVGQDEVIFACGCFWGAEKGFWKLPGVVNTAVGYAGGYLENPTYRQVCSGSTGHTEVVKVKWEESIIDLSDLLKMFWECHDPTQGNRQGNDYGSQYRSAIYVNNSNQMNLIQASKQAYQKELNEKGFGPITTEIKENQEFYYAEAYHQQYLAKPGSRPYCSAMPTKVQLKSFPGSNFKLNQEIWSNFDWEISHCVLRGDNKPIKQSDR